MRKIGGGEKNVKKDEMKEERSLESERKEKEEEWGEGKDRIIEMKKIGGSKEERGNNENKERESELKVKLIGKMRKIEEKKRGKIGIKECSIEEKKEFDERRKIMDEGKMIEKKIEGNERNLNIMRRKIVGMNEGNGDRFIELRIKGKKRFLRLREGERILKCEIGKKKIVKLKEIIVKGLRIDDLGGKDVIELMIEDIKRIEKKICSKKW